MQPRRFAPYLWTTLLLTLSVVSGCFARTAQQAPTDQLIRGGITITSEWQTITLDNPLKTLPLVQMLQFFLDEKQYKFIDNVERSEFHAIDASYSSIKDNKAIKLSVILIDKDGNTFRPSMISTGQRKTTLGVYHYLAYGVNPTKTGKFYYPENVEFVAIKVKSDTNVRAEHMAWQAPYFYQAPDKKWDAVNPSEIVTLD